MQGDSLIQEVTDSIEYADTSTMQRSHWYREAPADMEEYADMEECTDMEDTDMEYADT